jgi:hypothetical protein
VYKMIAIMCGLLLFSTAASAQRFNVFAGYSYSGFGPVQGQPLLAGSPAVSHSLNGWNGSLEAKILPILGIVADLSGHYGNGTASFSCSPSPFLLACSPNNANVSLYTFTLGPQISLRLGKFEPYAHVLVGGALHSAFLRSGSFADVLGGGVDF